MEIEQTSKKYKKMYIFAWIFLVLGVVTSVGAQTEQSTSAFAFAFVFWSLAIVFYVYARFGAWWHHG